MKTRSLVRGVGAGMAMLVVMGFAGCPCDLRNHKVGARVVITSITAPPGGPGRRDFEVTASGFHANAPGKLTLTDFPTTNGVTNIEADVRFDAQGRLTWTKDAPFLLPSTDADGVTKVAIRETSSPCFAATTIAHREFMRLAEGLPGNGSASAGGRDAC
jgi:hypothetical protein